MAAPYFVNASTGTTDATGGWTHTSAAPAAAGNILIVQVLQDGTAASPTITSVTNAENLAGTDNVLTFIGEFDIGNPVAASQHLWIGRSLSTSAMVITGANAGGDDVYVRVYEFSHVNTGTTLADVIENSTAGSTANGAGTGTTVSDTAVTTLGVDRLALNFCAANDDVLTTVDFTGETGGDWKSLAAAYADSAGTDGSLLLQGAYPGVLSYNGANSNVSNVLGATGTSEMQAQSFLTVGGGTVTSPLMKISKAGTPIDGVIVEIQTNSGGVPSGTVVGTSSAEVVAADIGTSTIPTSFSLSATLSAATTYHLVVRRTGARDAVNNYGLSGTNPGTYANGANIQRNSGTWAASGSGDSFFSLQQAAGSTIDGGTLTMTSAGWGVVGLALIGTTVPEADFTARPLMIEYQQAVGRGSLW